MRGGVETMTEREVLALFEERRALLKGHFRLSSGLHSDTYLQCALILQYPELAGRFAAAAGARFSGSRIDLVVGPALGGVTWAYEVARALGVRGIFAERQDGVLCLRRGFAIVPGERVLVAEDVVTTGASTKEVIAIVAGAGGIVAGVASIINRSDGPVDFGAPYVSLAKVTARTYDPARCPLCAAGGVAVKPGSRA